MRKAAQGAVAEIQLGELAQQKSQDQDVKDFGARMVKDHTNALERLRSVAATQGVELPATPAPDAQKDAERLRNLSGGAFDREYADHMVKDHQKEVAEFERVSRSGKDAAAEFATEILPTLREHLQLATNLQRNLQ